MRKKQKPLELQKQDTKRKFKDECENCLTYKEDVHSYYDADNKVYILCPDCAKKNKLIIKNWLNEPIERENKRGNKSRKSKDNKNTSNTENVSEDKGQLLHSRVSRRKRNTEQPEHKSRGRKKTLI